MNDETSPLPAPAAETEHAHKLFVFGVCATGAYVFAIAAYAAAVWPSMLKMSPDQFATFLSGVFAPLAFLWLVLGFRQQGDELRNSAKALWLQGEELRNSVEQQRQLVEVSREQLASERDSWARAQSEADHAAQPRLVMTTGGSYGGLSQRITFRLANAGPTCSQLKLFWNDKVVWHTSVFEMGNEGKFECHYKEDAEIKAGIISVEYTDSRGSRKVQRFDVPVTETGGYDGRRTLLEPIYMGTENI